MCAVCGLPTTHSNTVQAIGLAALFSFAITTYLGVWWVLKSCAVKEKWNKFLEKLRDSSG